ncbi:MAG: ABC transporter permease [Phycisphaerales bacterium]|nr:ABC transporter permease [Phycisphaerales bacterium]
MQVWALIVDSFRDAIDRKIFWIMLVLSAATAGAMACVSFDAEGVNVLFGTWHIDSEFYAVGSETGRSAIAATIIKIVFDLSIGWVGIILALIATAGMVPAMMSPGAVDILVSKPMSRHKLFFGKYVGAMAFVLMQATVFVFLTTFVAGWRWKCWILELLWLIPLTVLLFSYVYGFCALFGVLTRNAMASLLLTLVAWVGVWAPQTLYETFVTFEEQIDPDQRYQRAVGALKWVLPKTQDIPLIAGKLAGAALMSDVIATESGTVTDGKKEPTIDPRQAEERLSDVNIAVSIASSLAFEGVLVAAASILFRRKDF